MWQIINQYPAAFEFTETYLTVLSDSMWIPVFSTFLFNCPQQRTENSMVRSSHTKSHKHRKFPLNIVAVVLNSVNPPLI